MLGGLQDCSTDYYYTHRRFLTPHSTHDSELAQPSVEYPGVQERMTCDENQGMNQ